MTGVSVSATSRRGPSPRIDGEAIAFILAATARGDCIIRGVTTTPYGLIIDCDMSDPVLQELKEGSP